MTFPKKKEFKSMLSAGKSWLQFFKMGEELLAMGTILKYGLCIEILGSLNACVSQVYPTSKMSELVLLITTFSAAQVCTPMRPSKTLDGHHCYTHPRVQNLNHQIFTYLVLTKDSL
jgi:hypothetical protein